MVRLDLLRLARERGLRVMAEGDRLVVRGPKTEEPLARELLANKAEIMAQLRGPAQVDDVPEPLRAWYAARHQRAPGIERARSRLVAVAGEILDYSLARWGQEARRWPVEILAGFYAGDLAAGLKAVLGQWEGWGRLNDELVHTTGPEVIAALWQAYSALPLPVQLRVQAAGDAGLSPPGCVVGDRVEEGPRG